MQTNKHKVRRLSAYQRQMRRQADEVALILSSIPDGLLAAQETLDAIRPDYERRLNWLRLEALTSAIFPDGNGGLRAKKNESEFEIAVKQLCLDDGRFNDLRLQYEAAQRSVEHFQNVQRNYRLIAELTAALIERRK